MIWFDYEQRELILWFVAFGLTVGVWINQLLRRVSSAGMVFPAQRLEGLKVGWRAKFVYTPALMRSAALVLILLALARPQVTQEESAEVEAKYQEGALQKQ